MEKEAENLKEENCDSDQDEWVGPLPSEATTEPQTKKRKVLDHEKLFLEK